MKTTQSTKWPSSNTRCGSDFPGRLAVKFKLRLHERGKNYVVDSYLLPPRKTGKITGKSHLALRGLVKTESETKSSSLVHILGGELCHFDNKHEIFTNDSPSSIKKIGYRAT